MTIAALPTAPSRSDTPDTFVTKADAFVAALATMVSEINAATLALNLNATSDTSASSVAIGTGAKTFTVSAGKSFLGGMFLVIADTAAPSTNYMFGQVTSYSGTSLVMNILSVGGSGTKTAWTISQSSVGIASGAAMAGLGANTFTGLQTFAAGANIASAATINLSTATGNTVHVTGTTPISAVTMTDGQWMRCIFDGACPLTYHATTHNLNTGGSSVTLEAGDSVFYMKSGSVVYGQIVKANGAAISGGSKIQPISASVAASALTISASSLSLDFRDTNLGSGTVTTVSGKPANLVISSGSTLGTVSGAASEIAVLAINNAGTIELAAVNMAGGIDLSESGVISTTAEGGAGAADSASVAYSTTARPNVAYRVLGVIRSTQATAGTWASAPSLIQGTGGRFAPPSTSMVRLHTTNGFGSTNTKIRRFLTTVANRGADISYADSSTLGGSFTVNTPGVYSISFTDNPTAAGFIGLSLNTSQPTTNIDTITTADILASQYVSGTAAQVCWTGYLNAGDVVRAHTQGSATGSGGAGATLFTMTRVA